jgi:hypothetical protein
MLIVHSEISSKLYRKPLHSEVIHETTASAVVLIDRAININVTK